MQALADSTLPLDTLNLRENNFDMAHALRIFAASNLPLKSLDLSGNLAGYRQCGISSEALARAPGLRQLQRLALPHASRNFTIDYAPLLRSIRHGITENGEHREVLPSLKTLLTGDPAIDKKCQNAIKARAKRIKQAEAEEREAPLQAKETAPPENAPEPPPTGSVTVTAHAGAKEMAPGKGGAPC